MSRFEAMMSIAGQFRQLMNQAASTGGQATIRRAATLTSPHKTSSLGNCRLPCKIRVWLRYAFFEPLMSVPHLKSFHQRIIVET